MPLNTIILKIITTNLRDRKVTAMKIPKPNISGFISNSIRILKLTTKPKKQEFMTIAKITAILIIVIGFIGYIFETIKWLLV